MARTLESQGDCYERAKSKRRWFDGIAKKNYAARPGARFAEGLLEQLSFELPARRSRWQLTSRTRLAASIAAGVILCTSLGVYLMAIPTSIVTFEQVVAAVNQTHNFTAMRGGIRILGKDSVERWEFSDGGLIIWNDKTGESLDLNVQQHWATLERANPGTFSDMTLYSMFRNYRAGEEKVLGQITVGNIHAQGFQLTFPPPNPAQSGQMWSIWVDPNTKLPLHVEEKDAERSKPAATVYDDIRFDVPLNDSLFSMTAPADYTVKIQTQAATTRPQFTAAPTTQESAAMTLVPLVGIGRVHFGESADDVIAAFGKPDRSPNRANGGPLFYDTKGLSVFFDHRERVFTINAGLGRAIDNFPSNFSGRTAKNIGLGSTWADIVSAYGEDDTTSLNRSSQLTLHYDAINLTFTLVRDRVTNVELGAQDPDAGNAAGEQCVHNMHEIAGLLKEYAAENGGNYPANWPEFLHPFANYDISWFICPGIGTWVNGYRSREASAQWVEQYSDFFFMPGLHTGNGRNVLLYEKDTNHHGEGMHVLYMDGHIEWMSLDEAHREIERTRAATRPSPTTQP
jgi:prepilin-type processing-associated H-X9-DG protein